MLLESHTVSRKTPRDGKLEITKQVASRLEAQESPLSIEVAGRSGPVTLGHFECTCRGPEQRHVHYFLESELLKRLEPNSQIDLELDAERHRLVVRPQDDTPTLSPRRNDEET